ncbi:MAG: HAD family phosphatase [Bacteroidales bacterium]|nr:HAD family phosphatase [Bacteroidales bacterium]
MKESMIKAVIFDIGGVLVNLNMDRCLRAFKERAGLEDIEEYLDMYHQRGFIKDLESGESTEEQFYASALSHCRPGTTAKTVAECFCELLDGVNDEKIELINRLKGHYDLYLLSNNNPISMRDIAELFKSLGIPFEETFKDLFISSEMKMLKPSAEIYREVIRRTGLQPGEILFIDDSMKNIDAALAQGIRAVFYDVDTSLSQLVESEL